MSDETRDKKAKDATWSFQVDDEVVASEKPKASVKKIDAGDLKRVDPMRILTGEKSVREPLIKVESNRPHKSAVPGPKERFTTDTDDEEYASIISRAFATLIDWALLGGLWMLLTTILLPKLMLAVPSLNASSFWITLGSEIALVLLVMVIPLAVNGRTFGKKLCSIQVTNADGSSIGVISALLREVIAKPVAMATVIGILMPLWSKKHRGLHDVMMGTIVIL